MPTKANIGDFYYSDNTFSSTIDATKTCVGIVYKVNTDGTTGMIVSLDEAVDKTWKDAQLWTSSKVLPSNMTWSATTQDELKALYVAWNGDATITANTTARTAFNAQITAANGMVFTNIHYWSSTQDRDNSAWIVHFADGSSGFFSKRFISSVRVVSAF